MTELEEYISDNYGICNRGADCYWGKDTKGRLNGCLHPNVGWRGKLCPHWQPTKAKTFEEIGAP